MTTAATSADADLLAKVKVRALAWLAKHHQVTIGQTLGYLMMTHQKHWPVVIEAWKTHGLSLELVQKLVENFTPEPPTPGEAA